MTGEFTALYLKENEFKNAIGLNSKFIPSYNPYLSIQVIKHSTDSIFEGFISMSERYDISKIICKNNPKHL